MAAKAKQVLRTRFEPSEQIKARHRPPRTAPLFAVERDDHDWALVCFGQSRGDDPDHTRVPVLRRQHVTVTRTQRLRLRLGLVTDPLLNKLAFVVGVIELGGDRVGPNRVVGQHQLDAAVGPLHPPGGIDSRRQAKTDRLLVNFGRIDLRDAHQRAQSWPLRSRQGDKTFTHETSVLADQRHAVGNGRQRYEVEILIVVASVKATGFAQSLSKLERHTGRAELWVGVLID